MHRLFARVSAISLLLAGGAALAAAIPPPPTTPRDSTADTIQGAQVADPYRWLENAPDSKVQAWSNAQNARTRGYLDSLPSEETTKAQLTKLITATSPSYSELEARGKIVFAM